jgi:hypothetical protein
LGNLLENVQFKDQGEGRTTLRWFFGRQVVRIGGGWNWLRLVSNNRLRY